MNKMIAKKKALEIIANFPSSGVLVVGDVMVDHFIWGKVARISPEAPVPVVDVQKDSVMLGGCANVLNTIYAMGGQVFVCLLYTSPSPRDRQKSRMPSSA